MKKALSARGAIELLESQQFSSVPPYCTSRQLKYEWLYNNSKTFESNVRRYVQSNIPGKDVGLLAKDLYASASHDIHTNFNYGSEVVVRRSNYQRDHLKLLEAICQTLHVTIKKL
uniref:Uncharacterized protein n=1 Tax=Acrobeloides nanus TaxID=290746 RepID=A0A914CSL7_9BILA